MTNWFVAGFFVLLAIFGLAFVITGVSGEAWAFLVGAPMLAVGGWWLANRYEGTNG